MYSYGGDSAVYGLKYGGRCIVAQGSPRNMDDTNNEAKEEKTISNSDSDNDSDLGKASKHYFLLGTTSLSESNEIHQVEYNEDLNELRCTAIFGHQDEVWHMAPNPTNSSLLCTIHTSSGKGSKAKVGRKVSTLWQFPSELAPEDSPLKVMPLEKVCDVPGSSQFDTVDFVWDTHGANRCMSVARDGLRMMSLEGSGSSSSFNVENTILRGENSTSFLTGFSHGRWDPHHRNEISASSGGNVFGYDLRISNNGGESQRSHTISKAHSQMIYDIDYNPNKPYCLMTCGDDCLIRFWDLRMASSSSSSSTTTSSTKPIAVLRNHTHWVRSCKYNPFHDQLVLSGGSDAAVDLWRISSISSAPLLEIDGEDVSDGSDGSDDGDRSDSDGGDSPKSNKHRRSGETTLDTLITRFDEAHEESVNSVAWSLAEAWTFASLSHDGRMVVNTVPSAEKYKILL